MITLKPERIFLPLLRKIESVSLGKSSRISYVANSAGEMIEKWWTELPHKFPMIDLDYFYVMPNHIHGIIVIVGADLRVCPPALGAHAGAPLLKKDVALSEIVQWFKTMTTNDYIRGVKQLGWAPFKGKLWQRNYYEHIIRNEDELDHIREYIAGNPINWALDDDNPGRIEK